MTRAPTRKRTAESFIARARAARAADTGCSPAAKRPATPDTSGASAPAAAPSPVTAAAPSPATAAAATAAAATRAAGEDIAAVVGHCARGQSYLPKSVMDALTLLAVPGSRLIGSVGPTSPGNSTSAGNSTDAGTSTSTEAALHGVAQDDHPTAATLIPREVSDARWTVITNELAGYTTPELPTVWAAEETDLIEAGDRVIAWAHHLQLGAIARLREAIGAHCETELSPAAFLNGCSAYDVEAEADSATADEIALVTGLPVQQSTDRMRLARDPYGRARVLTSRLHHGTTTLDRCLRILDATSDCQPDDVNTIADRVLAELPDGSKPSHQLFTRRLRRQVILHQPDPTTRRAGSLTRRTAFGELLDDGTGVLTVTGDGERIVAALDRIDTLARTLRSAGDSRPLINLRSDVALDLLLVGWPTTSSSTFDGAPARTPASDGTPTGRGTSRGSGGKPMSGRTPTSGGTSSGSGRTSTGATEAPGRSATAAAPDPDDSHGPRQTGVCVTDPPGTKDSGGHDPTSPHDRDGEGGDAAEASAQAEVHAQHEKGEHDELADPIDLVDLTPWLTLKHHPPAQVTVIVPLTTLLGEDDATAEIPGHGFITAAHARQLAMATGSVWRRLVTDPLNGTALDLSTYTYRPTRKMAELVAALDGLCRAPGCTIPAPQCDIDHHTPWPHGPTEIRNLSTKHRRHHNHKTRRTWIAHQDHDGTVTWRTIGGRDYVTTRYHYTDPTHQPASDVEHARTSDIDPPPF